MSAYLLTPLVSTDICHFVNIRFRNDQRLKKEARFAFGLQLMMDNPNIMKAHQRTAGTLKLFCHTTFYTHSIAMQ